MPVSKAILSNSQRLVKNFKIRRTLNILHLTNKFKTISSLTHGLL